MFFPKKSHPTTTAFNIHKFLPGLTMILAINHIIACCWYGIGSLSFDGKSWILLAEIESAGFAEAYAASIHWALTQCLDDG